MRSRLAVLVLAVLVSGCSGSEAVSLDDGSVCSINNGDGSFGVAKILKFEPGIIHVRVYKNKFSTRPTSVAVEDLSLGSINDPDGFGVGHLPINPEEFVGWKPNLLFKTKVTDSELEGYEMWKEQGGGTFGN